VEIVKQTSDELVIRCTVTFARVFGIVFIVIGAFLGLIIIGSIPQELHKPPGEGNALGALLCGGSFAACFLVPGIMIYRRAKDTLFVFDGRSRILQINWGETVEDLGFDRVRGAVVVVDKDNDYSLELQFNNREALRLSEFVAHETPPLDAQANAINQFLANHP